MNCPSFTQLVPRIVHHMTLFLEVLEDGWINWIKIHNPEREMNICFVRWVRGNDTYTYP